MRPGTNVSTSTAVPPVTPATKTGTWFAVGPATQGPVNVPVLITSFAQYQRIFGSRGTTAATFSDSIEQFFLEGGSRVYIVRVVGAAAKQAIAKLKHVAAESIEVKAIGAGTWANTWHIVVAESGGTFTLSIKNSANEVVETSPPLTSPAEAASWSATSSFVIIVATGTENPSAGEFLLNVSQSGTDEPSGIVTATYEAALAACSLELGPGQLSVPGVTTTAVIEALFKAAQLQKRVAVADAPNKASKASLETLGEAIRNLAGSVARCGIIYADWFQVAPLSGTVGNRLVPASAFLAAHCAENDATTGNPNLAPVGKLGILNALAKEATFSEAEVESLYLKGINFGKSVFGQIRLYGFRTPVNATTDPLYFQFSNIRLDMAITWKALAIQEEFFGSEIDGQGYDAGNYGGQLAAMMLELFEKGAVFGRSSEEAFLVEVGPNVNGAQSESEGNLNANIAVRRSPGAEQVNLNITRVSITQAV